MAALNSGFAAAGSDAIIHYSTENRGRLIYRVGIAEHFLASYEQCYGSLNRWYRGLQDLELNSVAWLGTARVPVFALRSTRYFREWLPP